MFNVHTYKTHAKQLLLLIKENGSFAVVLILLCLIDFSISIFNRDENIEKIKRKYIQVKQQKYT